MTSAFGMRLHPVLKVWKLHDGTDFAAACGTAIRAPYAGVVTRAYYSPAYGNRLFVSHGSVAGVQVETAFNHAARYLVRPGQRVSSGPGDRCGREYRPLDRLPSAPDAVAQWAAQQPDELVMTRLCPELVEGRTSTSSARNRLSPGVGLLKRRT